MNSAWPSELQLQILEIKGKARLMMDHLASDIIIRRKIKKQCLRVTQKSSEKNQLLLSMIKGMKNIMPLIWKRKIQDK